MISESKTKAKSKPMPAKKPLPASRKASPQPPKKATPVKKAEPVLDEDGTSNVIATLAECSTEVIANSLLKELSDRLDYVIAEKSDIAENMADLWVQVKRMEQYMVGVRRALEDAMLLIYPADDEEAMEGTDTYEVDGFNIKIARKLTRTVGADELTELSEEYDVDDVIARVFRFKPELNLSVYRAESDEVRELFSRVITEKPARPTFTITASEE